MLKVIVLIVHSVAKMAMKKPTSAQGPMKNEHHFVPLDKGRPQHLGSLGLPREPQDRCIELRDVCRALARQNLLCSGTECSPPMQFVSDCAMCSCNKGNKEGPAVLASDTMTHDLQLSENFVTM